MFYTLTFNGFEVDVNENTFLAVLTEVKDINHVVAVSDDDGCYYYHLWHNDNSFSKIGYSDCLFKEVLYEN